MKNQDARSMIGKQGAGGGARVAHLTTVHHPQDPRISHKELPTLQEAGFDVVLVVSGRDDQMPSGISTVSLPTTESRLQRLPLLWTVYRRACSVEADVYHLHDPELIPVGFFLKWKTGAIVIYDMHEDYGGRNGLEGGLLRGLERWCFSWVDHVVTAERSYASIVPADVPYTFVGNYYKPYDTGPPSTQSDDSWPPWQLLYTGSMSRDRGLFTMIDLAARLRERERGDTIRLVGVYRQTDQRRRAEQRIRALELDGVLERIGWTEYVPARDMTPHYRQADVGLALFEPTPNHTKSLLTKFYEYLHFGLPIICTDIPLWRSFVETHECGAVVPPGDMQAVLDVLARWEQRPEAYRACAQNARAAASEYEWDTMGSRLVQTYRDVLARSEEK